MDIKDIFTTYWSQVTLILLAIGYFIKRVFDTKSKKIEINHSLFQQNRISSLNNFFSNYAKVELMWHQLAVYEVLSNKLTSKEIDSIIFPSINDLKRTLLELRVYFKEEDYKDFQKLTNGLISINEKLSFLYFDFASKDLTVLQKKTSFDILKNEVLEKNNILLGNLCIKARENFDA